MQQTKLCPAVIKAADYIRGALDNGVWQQGQILPSVTRLAEHIGVSRVSVIRALALLKMERRISGGERSRTRAGSNSILRPPPESTGNGWQLKRTKLETDILSGVFANRGVLPSFKELQEQYGACYQTMRKMVNALVSDGVVTRHKKKHILASSPASSSGRRVVFITNRLLVTPSSALNPGHYRVVEHFEQECMRRGLTPEIVEADFYDPSEMRRLISSQALRRGADGFIVDIWWYFSNEFNRSFFDLLTRLSVLKKPVAILDELGEVQLPVQFVKNQLFQVFSIEGVHAGEKIARMLLSLGHHRVAYISSFHNQPYSRQRLDGVIGQYANSTGNAVVPFVTDKIEQPLAYVFALSGLRGPQLRRIMAAGRTENQAADLYKLCLGYRKSLGSLPVSPEDRAAIQKNLAGLPLHASRGLDKKYFDHGCLAYIGEAEKQLTGMCLAPLFERALAGSDITAWICANDDIAVSALEFLRQRRVAVPREISIVGFDNKPAVAVENRLTTYDFNASGFVHRMVDFIVRPPRHRGPINHAPIEVEGLIVVRSTAGRPSMAVVR